MFTQNPKTSSRKGAKAPSEELSGKPGVVQAVRLKDAEGKPVWARFYEIGANRPIFVGRDGVVKYDVKQIEEERRENYAWYVYDAAKLLSKDYPAWLNRRSPETK